MGAEWIVRPLAGAYDREASVTADQPAQPEPLVVTLIFEDLNGHGAYGYRAEDGTPTVHADRKVLTNDPAARATAFSALVRQTGGGEN